MITLLLLALLAIIAVAATLVVAARDGYRPAPRRSALGAGRAYGTQVSKLG